MDAGIDVPTDGEVRRENYIFYQCRHLHGFDFERLTEKVARDGAFTARLPTITGAVTPRELILARDWRVAQRVTDHPVKITLPGPMTIADSVVNKFYPDPRAQGQALAEALNAEVHDLAAAGCRHIQVDEPVFARKPRQALEYGIEHLERVFHGVPEHVQRIVHMCCGYPSALDLTDYPKADPQAYFRIANAMDDASIDAVSLEDAHRHNDLGLLERYTRTTVLLGVVDVSRSRVEPVDEIALRLGEALEHIDPQRLVAAPDCGLGLLGRGLALDDERHVGARAVGTDAFAHRQTQVTRDQRIGCRLSERVAVVLEPLAHFEDIPVPLGGEQAELRALALQQRIGRDGGAVNDALGRAEERGPVDAGRLTGRRPMVHHRRRLRRDPSNL